MSRFYGFSFDEINAMPIAAIKVYLTRLPVVKAEEKLMLFEASNTVWMGKRDKRRTLRSWQRTAFGSVPARKAKKSDLPMLGIGKD